VTLEAIGIVVATALAAAVILDRHPARRAAAMLGALVLTPILLVGHVWGTPQFEPLRSRPLFFVVGTVLAVVALAAAALVLERHPAWFPLAVAAAVPFRVPIESGGETANLLVPLYAVIGAGALAFVLPRLRPYLRRRRGAAPAEDGALALFFPRRSVRPEPEPEPSDVPAEHHRAPERPHPGLLEKLLAAAVVVYALQVTYSTNFAHGLEQVVFFYAPFALLFVLLSRIEWSERLAVRCLAVLVALGVVFAAVGFFEELTRNLVLSSNAIDANSYQSYFRTSSLFLDPNIYGRYLAVVMVLVTAVVLWSRDRGRVLAGGALLLVFLAALVLTLSQSSLGMLLVGLVVLAALFWGTLRVLLVAGGLVAIAAAVVLAAPGLTGVELSHRDLNKTSSGRVDLIDGGLDLFRDRPLWGYGGGSFEKEFRAEHESSRRRAAAASHTIPVTVAAEQGIVGLAVYLALLVAAFARLWSGAWTSLRRSAVAAAFTALVFHTLLYAAFLEDPLSWALLGVGTALAWQLQPSPRERALARAERRAVRAARLEGPEPQGATAATAATP
jgi:O-antigen ligase